MKPRPQRGRSAPDLRKFAKVIREFADRIERSEIDPKLGQLEKLSEGMRLRLSELLRRAEL